MTGQRAISLSDKSFLQRVFELIYLLLEQKTLCKSKKNVWLGFVQVQGLWPVINFTFSELPKQTFKLLLL
jgi:hypothetical protein